MTYEEARAYIAETGKYGSVMGLSSMLELTKRLGNPENDLKFIHIAGTNGKGSTLAYLSTILKCAGYKVGRYISPTVFGYRERIQVNEKYIPKEDLARLIEPVKEAYDQMVADGLAHPTCFEVETALAFLYFREMNCDLIVLETGLGGRTDATNVVQTSILTVFAHISVDHIGILGNTLREVASVKAGIMKPGVPSVSMMQQEDAVRVLQAESEEKGGSLKFVQKEDIKEIHYGPVKQTFSYKTLEHLEIPLGGSYQIENAVLAVEAALTLGDLGYPVSTAQIQEGLRTTVWNGRFMTVSTEPLFLVDGAHNLDAAERLRETLKLCFPDKRLIFIMGVFSDKEYEKIVEIMAPLAAEIVTVMTPDNVRALPAEELAEVVKKHNSHVRTAESLADGVAKAYALAEKEDVIISFGSLSYIRALMQVEKEYREKKAE